MPRTTAPGTCNFCRMTLSKAGMTAHLKTCAMRQALLRITGPARPRRPASFFHLLVEGREAPEYWMHLELASSATLAALDAYLRFTWLECCGHLSAFSINGQEYASDAGVDDVAHDDDDDGQSMDVTVDKLFRPGMPFSYEYDFGDTTPLRLWVVATRTGNPAENPIEVLAHNDPPVPVCNACGAVAEQVCVVCNVEEEDQTVRWLCGNCEHEHAGYGPDELYLPVMDSPRVGQCAYGAGL